MARWLIQQADWSSPQRHLSLHNNAILSGVYTHNTTHAHTWCCVGRSLVWQAKSVIAVPVKWESPERILYCLRFSANVWTSDCPILRECSTRTRRKRQSLCFICLNQALCPMALMGKQQQRQQTQRGCDLQPTVYMPMPMLLTCSCKCDCGATMIMNLTRNVFARSDCRTLKWFVRCELRNGITIIALRKS